MRILIAEDDLVSRRMLEATLVRWGYEVIVTCDGRAALEALQQENPPKLAILDWMMPELDGLEVCRSARALPAAQPAYLLLLTAKGSKEDIVTGLEAGADDYLTKPFDRDELRARVRVGLRIVDMQQSLADRVRELEDALSKVKQLQGLIPICAYCKKVRDDQNYWQQVDAYMAAHSEARFTHGICPACLESVVKPELEKMHVSQERLDMLGESEQARQRRELVNLLREKGGTLSVCQLLKCWPLRYRTTQDAEAALDELVKMGLAVCLTQSCGQPASIFRLSESTN